ncbi:MAG TPA: signal peptidase I [Actinomycetota bacterium]|nr:signal peptidase I [Actinomycetota bacterium]
MGERPPGSEEPVEETSPASTTASASTDAHPEAAGQARAAGRRGSHRIESRSVLSFLRELPVLIVLALALAIVLKTFVVQAFYIPSGSMEPTLGPGDRVLVNKIFYRPSRGDVVVFSDPKDGRSPDRGIVGGFLHWLSEGLGFARPEHEDFIKRVIGLPGETVEIRDGKLFVDGTRIAEPYLRGPVDTRDYGPTQVPADSLFVLGDNRLNSNDSRFGLGFVPVEKVIGRAFVIIWPPSRAGWAH